MGSHKRSFQCFDTILDDTSHNPSLSYGHRCGASHMSSPGSNRLEQLDDHGCHLCADHQQATAMISEASGAYSTPWYHFHPHSHRYMTRRLTRPEEAAGEFEDHHYHHHKYSRRIVLVKNSDPSFRRTIVLHRRSLRSLGLFMDEVSELMKCPIRKLYTVDGHKVDSVQSLLQCAGILVCVGREPFHPLLLDSFRKTSNDKLPRLNIKSRSSAGSDDKGAKKNVNFGFETKRNIIHPRCDSSNTSARLASPEKLFPNRLNSMPPGHAGTCPRARDGMMDDDIKKRVLVNKDGSLSMEMKVRFRLLHDETLHWSTEIKKSASTLKECHTAHDDACCLSHGSAESCSEVQSFSAGEVEETYKSKRYQKHFEDPHCHHCCAQCQEYDIWKNPILPDQTAVRHIRSSSSSASSRRIVHKKASTDSMRTMSSEEYTEHVIEKIEKTFGTRSDASIKHCTINCCCRRSQVCSKPQSTNSTEQKYEVPEKTDGSDNDMNIPDNSKHLQKEQLSLQIAQPIVDDERPVSTVSSSSQILTSLKEDQDEEDVGILPNILRASHDSSQQEDENDKDAELNSCSATPCRSPASMTHLSPKPPNRASSLGRSKTYRKLTSTEIDVDKDYQNVRPGSAEPALSGSQECKCSHAKDTEKNKCIANDVDNGGIKERALSKMSDKSKLSTKSPSILSVCSQNDTESTEEHQDITEERSSSAISIKSCTSEQSVKSNVAEILEQEGSAKQDERAPSAISIESHISDISNYEMSEVLLEDQEAEVRTSSSMSVKSNTSMKSKRYKISENDFENLANLQDNDEERTISAMSGKSSISAKSSQSKQSQSKRTERTEKQIEKRACSVKSAMSNRSGVEVLKDQIKERASSAISLKSNNSDRSKMSFELSELEEHEQFSGSASSHVSQKSKSEISEACSFQVGDKEELQERTARDMSATSVKSLKSSLSDVLPATTVQPHDEDLKERVQSVLSTKSNPSVKLDESEAASWVESELPGERSPSSMSSMSHISATSKVSEGDQEHIRSQDEEEVKERASSAISAKSNTSSRSRKFETTPTNIEIKEQALSAMSSKSKASLKSNKSNVSSVAPKEHVDMRETGKRASSAMSATSEVSTSASAISTKSDLAAVEIVAEEYNLRSANAMSSKSNISTKSEFSELVIEGPVETDDQKEGNAQSALSAKSNKSGISVVTNEVDVAVSLRVMSSTSNASQRSKKSNISKAKHQTEERSHSALSAKSNVSQQSQESNASAMAVKADDKKEEDRVSSAMSEKSCISTKSAKSKGSNISETSPQEPDEREDKTPSVMSIKSSVSRSHKSKTSCGDPAEAEVHNRDKPSSAVSSISNISTQSGKSITSEATQSNKETTTEPEIKERVVSAMSAKSSSSVRTRTSKVSEIIIDEPCEQKVGRASSSRSLKSDVSGRFEKSNVSETRPKNVVSEDEDKEERAASVLSTLSNVSGRSKHSEIIPDIPDVSGSDIEERALSVASVTSVKTKSSNISSVALEETEDTGFRDAEVSFKSSNVLAKSNASTKSKTSLFSEAKEPEERSISVLSSASVESKLSKADVESNRSPSMLSAKSNVSARSKKFQVSQGKDIVNIHTNKSPVSDHLKVSQAGSNKCTCEAIKLSPMVSSEKDSDHEEIPVSPLSTKSAKSKISSVVTTSESALTPTSTSVSIGIEEDCEADDVEKIDESAISVISQTSASSETEICATFDKDLLEFPAQMTNDRATQTPEERPKSISEKSKSKHSHCSTTWLADTALHTNQGSQPSANISTRQSSPIQEIRSSSKASNVSVQSGILAESTVIIGQGAAESPEVSNTSQSICSKCSSTQNRGKTSTALVTCTSVSSISAVSERSRSNISNSSSHLQDNDQNVEATVNNGDGHSGRSKKSCKSTQTNKEDMVRCYSATLAVTSTNHLSPSPPKSPKKSPKPVMLLVGSKDSQTVPGKSENVAKKQPNGQNRTYNSQPDTTDCIGNVSNNKNEKSSKCRKRIESSSSCQRINDDASELNPSCLPNASPTEVVNEWLKKIPSDTALCDLGDEFHENFIMTGSLCTFLVPSVEENERKDMEEYDVTKPEKQNKVDDAHSTGKEGTVNKKAQENHTVCENDRQHIWPEAGDESKVLDSSVLVMKVLLSPKIDRCNSLPEVSPVYGRKLSTSAQGLLDCLAKLELLDFGPNDEKGKNAKYQELMSMLKSLWLCDPEDSQKCKDQQLLKEELKARSSSGIDVNSGSTNSGKSSVLEGTQAQTNTEYEGPNTLTKVQEVDETAQEEPSKTPESKCKSITPDIASRERWTLEGGAKDPVEEKPKDNATGSDETIRNNDSPRELIETPLSSNKSSGNHAQNKETETDHQEDTSSGSRPASQKPQLSKRVSQDPDPIWVLNLLNKLEKQFMTHYVNAMDEFKVRWNLDDSEQLDVMICELQDEVHKRIQTSVNRELKKIQGRAGRPRPPKEAMSRESTVQTEQRRRHLKVMRNQSIDPQPAKSEDDYTATGTDFSDQRSDDEYCPCDTCLKKKMISKPVVPVEILNSAPVMMDFDLRKILQIKKSAPNNEKTTSECKFSKMEDAEENVTLAAVKEEDDIEGIDASTAQEIRKDDDKERKTDDCEKEEDASSTSEKDASEKLSDTSGHFKKDINEEVEVVEVGRKEGMQVDNETNSKNDNLSKNTHNAMEVKQDRNHVDTLEKDDKTVDDETAEKQNAEVESVDVDDSTGEKSVETEQTAKDETAEEGEISEVKTAEEGETAEDKTAEEGETAEDKTAEEGETAEDKTAEEGETAEDKTVEESEISEVKTVEESEISEVKTAEESEISEIRTAEERETSEDETAEDGEISEVKTAEDGETDEDETAEEGEISKVKTAEKRETTEDETAEECETAEVKSAEKSETAEDETAEDDEISKIKTAEESETAEDETTEEDETAKVKSAEECDISAVKSGEESETAEEKKTKDGEISEVKMAEESETAEDETAEEGETSDVKTAEDGETDKDETAEEGEISKVKMAEESESVVDETAEEGETSEVKMAEESETAEDETAEEGETAEVNISEESQTAKDEAADEGEISNDDNIGEGETTEDITEENYESAEDEMAAKRDTAVNETAEEGNTASDDIQEEHETSVNASIEDNTAESETAADEQTAIAATASDSETATDDQSAERESAEEDKTADDETTKDEQNVETSARDDETSDHETTDEVEAFVKDGQPAEAETAVESGVEKDDDEGEIIDEDRNSIDNKDELVKETLTADDKSTETADEEPTEAVKDATFKAEEDLTEDEELAEQKKTPNNGTAKEETAESHSECDKVKETNGHKRDILSNPDDTEYDDVIELKADKKETEEKTLFKNEGDVVIDSIGDKAKESGKEDDLGDKGCNFADIGESAEGGDEAEDDTEPDMEIDESEHNGKVQALQSTKQEDDKPNKTTVTSFDVVVNHNSVYDADVEDSETEVHNQIQDLSSESESKPLKKTARKTFKTLIHTLAFLKPIASQKVREDEEGDDEERDEETPDGSDYAEDSSCVEKEECEKEKGKLSDITEDTAEEENQETETGNTTKDYSEESEWETSENALEKQFTKSSMESQPGSFDKVLDEQVKSLKSSNHVMSKANR